MSFTQENKTNISTCDGCEKRCRLHWCFKLNRETNWVQHYPTIDGQKITKYIDEAGNTILINLSCLMTAPNNLDYVTEAINKAHEISKLCDHYKVR